MAKQDKKTGTTESRVGILRAVKTPLGFYALVVLVVEAILGITASFSQGSDRTFLIIGMIVLMLLLVLIVALLAFFRPEALSGKRRVADEENLSPSQKIRRYHELILKETKESLLQDFNTPVEYRAEISTLDKYAFGFCYPQSWIFSKLPEQIIYGVVSDPNSEAEIGFSRNMNVVIADITDINEDLDKIYENSVNQTIAVLSSAELRGHEPSFIFQGLKAARWVIDWTPRTKPERTLSLYQVAVANRSRRHLYVLSFTTTRDNFDASIALFHNMLNTLRIEDIQLS